MFECNGNSVIQELYSDAACTDLISSSTYQAYLKQCGYTSGVCTYALLSSGCIQSNIAYKYYAVPVNTCFREYFDYFKASCSGNSISLQPYGSSSSCSGSSINIGIGGGCDTVNGEAFQALGCGTKANGPTVAPTTAAPTTGAPTAPTTAPPTGSPTLRTDSPTPAPSDPSLSPTASPTRMPSPSPTRSPLDAGETHPPTKPPTIANDGDIYLGEGSTEAEGRVFIFYNGKWGTVCDDNTDKETEGVVICRQLGYDYVAAFDYKADVSIEGQIWLDSVECEGTETALTDCSHADWGVNNCGHRDDLWIRCTNDQSENIVTAKNTSSAKRLVAKCAMFLIAFVGFTMMVV